MRHTFFYYLSTFLIIFSVVGFFFTFYPLIKIYFFPSPISAVEAKDFNFYLIIPKIHAQGEVIENVDPSNQEEYDTALKKGIAHAKGTSLPGQHGTIFLFAHSSGAPWEITRYNTIFLRLGELQENDRITLYYKAKKFDYKVITKKEVWPNETQYLQPAEKDELILQTCTPIGTDLKRLLIFAVPA